MPRTSASGDEKCRASFELMGAKVSWALKVVVGVLLAEVESESAANGNKHTCPKANINS